MLDTFATHEERTSGVYAAAIVLGIGEDVKLVTILLVLLSAVDWAVGPTSVWAREAATHPYFVVPTSPSTTASRSNHHLCEGHWGFLSPRKKLHHSRPPSAPAIPAVTSATALNNTLNELFRTTTRLQLLKSLGDGSIESASVYIDASSESYELFRDDVLYRKTLGFKGPLAFDVAVNVSDPPNVIVLVVESFRRQDSLYMLGANSQRLVEKQKNITLTPQFRWAKRGIAFRNMWSSWQTSRSLEEIHIGQVPFDHITDSGTSGGRLDVELHGMPQFFKHKGYETLFTTGTKITYDQWNKFPPSHGFDEVLSYPQFKTIAEETKHVHAKDWREKKREFSWGVHDDLSFKILGDLLLQRMGLDQKQRVARGESKQPLFVNHFTISSHTPFRAVPSWFDDVGLPHLGPLYEGHQYAYDVWKYARIRYFTDLAMGRFLDRMKAAGVLEDTIVLVVGDHGQSPETSLSSPDIDQVATTRVAVWPRH